MKSLWVIVSLVVCVTTTDGLSQKEVATIDVNIEGIKDLQTFDSNDTSLIVYTEQSGHYKNLIELFPNGKYLNVFARDIIGVEYCGFETSRGISHYYYLDASKKVDTLNAIRVDRYTGKREVLKSKFIFEDQIIDVINEDGITVVTRGEERNSIKLCKIKGYNQIQEEEFLLPEDFGGKKARDFGVIRPGMAGWLYEAMWYLKIYVEDRAVMITYDNKESRVTRILKYDRVNKNLRESMIPAGAEGQFNSYVTDSIVFRLDTTPSKFTIRAFDLQTGLQLSQQEILRDGDRNREIYTFKGASHTKEFGSNLSRTIALSGFSEPVILAQKISDQKYNIAWGTFAENKGVGSSPGLRPGLPGFNVLSLVVFVATTAAKQAAKNGPTLSRYLYASFNNGKIGLWDNNLVFKRIDNFEIKELKNFRSLDYLVRNKDSALVFGQDLNTKKIKVLKFD